MTTQAKHRNQPVNRLMNMRALICMAVSALITFGNSGRATAGELTAAICEADHKELLASIERNRIAGINQINDHLLGVTDEKERTRLIEMREKSWDEEEQQRTMAASIRRDCLAAAKD